jgi:hypothetical protein
MNKLFTIILMFFSFINYDLMAACGGTFTSNVSIVSGKLMQGSHNGESWNEVHCSNNNKLWDLKKGNSDPVDRSEYVGEWRLNGNQLEHKYDTLIYRYDLYELGGENYCLQGPNGDPSINVTIKTVQNPGDVCKDAR